MSYLQQRISQLSTQTLQDSAFIFTQDDSEESVSVLDALLDELMKRMKEEDFVKLCRKLEW